MKTGLFGALTFLAGGAAGFALANGLMKQKYEQRVQDEVDSIRAKLGKGRPQPEQKKDEAKEEERRTYSRLTAKLGYSQQVEPEPKQAPYVIGPDAFGEAEGYDEISLTLYADGTVTDDNDRAMSEDEIEETIGKDSLSHFGEYEADSVFVRNDRLKADYEILKDLRSYAEVLQEKPYLKLM